MSTIEEFELKISCMPEQSFEVLEILREHEIEFEVKEKTGFAPITPEVLLDIIIKVGLPVLLNVIPILFKKFHSRNIKIEFDTRFAYAKKMLADKKPLLCQYREDRENYSKYVFKTKESKFYWEFDRGNIKYGKE